MQYAGGTYCGVDNRGCSLSLICINESVYLNAQVQLLWIMYYI